MAHGKQPGGRGNDSALQAKMSVQILPLAVDMCSDFSAPQLPNADSEADQFWMSMPVDAAQHADCPHAIVSTYYKRGLVTILGIQCCRPAPASWADGLCCVLNSTSTSVDSSSTGTS